MLVQSSENSCFVLTLILFSSTRVQFLKQYLAWMYFARPKSGHGKTAVFVLATLQQLDPVNGEVSVLVLCHTRELAYQIRNEYNGLRSTCQMYESAHLRRTPITKDSRGLEGQIKMPPHRCGNTGKAERSSRDKILVPSHVKHFVLDECDKMLEQLVSHKKTFRLLRISFCLRAIGLLSIDANVARGPLSPSRRGHRHTSNPTGLGILSGHRCPWLHRCRRRSDASLCQDGILVETGCVKCHVQVSGRVLSSACGGLVVCICGGVEKIAPLHFFFCREYSSRNLTRTNFDRHAP